VKSAKEILVQFKTEGAKLLKSAVAANIGKVVLVVDEAAAFIFGVLIGYCALANRGFAAATVSSTALGIGFLSAVICLPVALDLAHNVEKQAQLALNLG